MASQESVASKIVVKSDGSVVYTDESKRSTPNTMTIHELADIFGKYTDLVSNAEGYRIFGYELKSDNAMLEAGRLMQEGKIPFVVMRDVLGDRTFVEVIDAEKMEFDRVKLSDVVEFVTKNSIAKYGPTKDIIENIMKKKELINDPVYGTKGVDIGDLGSAGEEVSESDPDDFEG